MSQSPTQNQHPRGPVGKLMLCNMARAGDTILCNSILDSAFQTYAHVDYICGRHNEDIIRADPRFRQVILVRNLPSGLFGLLKASSRCRYDGFISLKDQSSTTSLIIAQLFRSRIKTGYNQPRFRPFQRDTRTAYSATVHKVETMRKIGAIAGLAAGDYRPFLALPSDSINWFQNAFPAFGPFIFINVSATGEARLWSADNWARYVRACGLSGKKFLVNGMPQDWNIVQQLCQQLPTAVPLRARSFLDAAAALACAELVLTVDTGIVHACSALGKPVVALYVADRSSTTYAPLSPWHLMIQPKTGIVSDIAPDQAAATTLRYGLPATG